MRAEARRWGETWMAFPMAPVDGGLLLEALQVSERFQISHFDAAFLAAANPNAENVSDCLILNSGLETADYTD